MKVSLGKHYNQTWKRLEDRTKAQYYTGSPRDDWRNDINNISSDQIKNAVNKALNSNVTLVAQGGQVNTISGEKVKQLFN